MCDLLSMRIAIRNKYLSLQSIYRVIDSEEFEKAYSQCSDNEKDTVNRYIQEGNKSLLSSWLRNKLRSNLDLEELSTGDLRELGKKYAITHYYVLTRDTLLSELRKII